ncbi:MAG TPA: CocE/NonD family hydrolase, partial [Acidimicrobiales bacterium]|nr:CocE/NonD family hydrolase [Acidimicrobiales bacterium]
SECLSTNQIPGDPLGATPIGDQGTCQQVGLPNGTTLPPGPDYAPPYPTLIEYSGYGYADPVAPESSIAALANLMGFAVVDVNMRGMGCSGGAFDFFEPLQSLDAYDVVETIAHQPWVLGHKVGMMGISYGGISQLFAAADNPPDLAAIAPLSVIDATATTLLPGGILNTGFAVEWAIERQTAAVPATKQPDGSYSGGQPWTGPQIEQEAAHHQSTCLDNQNLHGEANNLFAKITANDYYNAPVADPIDPITFVNKIKVPVFMACQWEDEQTGGHCADLVSHFTGTRLKWFNFTNGAHIDSLDPYTYDHWYDFLELFVAHRAPLVNAAVVHASAPVVYQAALGTPTADGVVLPPDPIQALPTYQAALSAFEKIPPVRVLFDNGAGSSPTDLSSLQTSQTLQTTYGDPYPLFDQYFSSFPVPTTAEWTGCFGPKGTLTQQGPGPSSAPCSGGPEKSDIFTADPDPFGPGALNDFGPNTGGGGLWGNTTDWSWNWKQAPSGDAVSYVTPPLSEDTTVIGAGQVDLWVKASTPDVDLQATISEVRPDGNETFVQNGWIRASDGQSLSSAQESPDGSTPNLLDQPSTDLEPVPTLTSAAAAAATPLNSGGYVEVHLPLYYEGHLYRKGSQIRVTISAPNGTQPIWSFGQSIQNVLGNPDYSIPTSVSATIPAWGGTTQVTIGYGPATPSRLILPFVPTVMQGKGQPASDTVVVPQKAQAWPPCPSLRNEPCRPYEDTANQS